MMDHIDTSLADASCPLTQQEWERAQLPQFERFVDVTTMLTAKVELSDQDRMIVGGMISGFGHEMKHLIAWLGEDPAALMGAIKVFVMMAGLDDHITHRTKVWDNKLLGGYLKRIVSLTGYTSLAVLVPDLEDRLTPQED